MGADGQRHLDQREEPRLPVPCRPVPDPGPASGGTAVLRGVGLSGPVLRRSTLAWTLGRHVGGHPVLQLGSCTGLRLAGHDAHLHRRLADRSRFRCAAVDASRHRADGTAAHHHRLARVRRAGGRGPGSLHQRGPAGGGCPRSRAGIPPRCPSAADSWLVAHFGRCPGRRRPWVRLHGIRQRAEDGVLVWCGDVQPWLGDPQSSDPAVATGEEHADGAPGTGGSGLADGTRHEIPWTGDGACATHEVSA